MTRPQIIANGGSPGIKASVSAGATITLTLDSTIGIRTVEWSVLSTDETTETTDYTLVQSGSIGQTATTTALTAGTAVLFKVIVNSGLVRGLPNLLETSNTIKVYVPTAEGFEVGTAGETYESDATHGTTGILNAPIRNLSTFTGNLYEADVKRALASGTSNVNLVLGPSTLDGVSIVTGDVVLLLGQTAPAENGLWLVNSTGTWTRPANFTTTDAVQGCIISVIAGTARAGYLYQNTNTNDPTIGTTALTFSRIPDRFDRADLASASSTPANGILARFGAASQLLAAYFSSNGTNPASSGLLRAVKNTVAVAFRDDANGADLEAVSMDGTDVLRFGSTLVDQILLSVQNAGEIRFLNNATAFLRHALTGTIFGRTATMSLTQEAAVGGAGTNATIEAQAGDAGFAGASLTVASGSAGSGSTPGTLNLDSKSSSTASGRISFKGGSFGEFVGFVYDDSAARTTIGIAADIALLDTKILELDATNLSVFSSPGSFGSGSKVIFIANATVTPSTDPTGGGILYVESGALRYRGSSGTVTNLAPA